MADNQRPPGPKLREVTERCKAAGLQYTQISSQENFITDEPGLDIQFQAGRDTRTVSLVEEKDAEALAELPFERFRFIAGYHAIADYDNGRIEALVRGPDVPLPTIARSLSGKKVGRIEESGVAQYIPFSVERRRDDGATERVSFGWPSKSLEFMCRYVTYGEPPHFAITIESGPLATHEQAHERLVDMANAFLFETDLKTGIAFALARSKTGKKEVRKVFAEDDKATAADVHFPKYVYPQDAMALYWYARSAVGMPLLQFLAFYQVIEYFFATYSQEEVRARVRNVLKDPAFTPEKDSDLTRLLSVIRPGAKGGYGDEKSQLRDTVNACISADDMRRVLTKTDARKEYFSKPKTPFSRNRISLGDRDVDVRKEVAERIYEIRCSIVHTKSGAEEERLPILLPFTPEADSLWPDIALVRFVAKQVLIASGRRP